MSATSVREPLRWWQDQLIAKITNASEALITAEIIRALNEFCRLSTVWRGPVLRRTAAPNRLTIDVNPVDDRRLAIQLLQVFYEGRALNPVNDLTPYQGASMRAAGNPSCWTTSADDAGSFVVDAAPSEAVPRAYDVLAVFEPVCPDAWLPTILTTNYREPILNMAMGMMLAHPDRPYSNPQLAVLYERRGIAKAIEARAIAARGGTPAAQSWRYRAFGT